jgi:MGT family glycosyltransferase
MDRAERRMPKVWDLSAEDAQKTLTAAGIPFVLHYAPNLIIPERSLIAVSPRPDTILSVDSEIILTISSGPPGHRAIDAATVSPVTTVHQPDHYYCNVKQVGRFLVVVWDAGGNVMSAAGLTRALVEHGHEVRVMGPAVLQTRFERAGARFRPFQQAHPPHSKETDSLDNNELKWARFQSGSRMADDVFEELKLEPTDVAVVDAVLSAGLAAAEKAGVPGVALVHFLYASSVEGPVATQWDVFRPMWDRTRRRLEIPEIDQDSPVMAGLWARCPIVLACAPQSFDFPSDDLPSNARYVGPIFDEPIKSPHQPGNGRVLVSFSTTAMDQGDLLQRTLDALAGDLQVVCTLGGVPIDDLSPPPNATVSDWISHSEVLPRTDVVVTHAGLSTVLTALSAGVPLVCMPMGRDQPLNAQRVATLGLGIALSPSGSAEEIREAVQSVLADGRFKQNAMAMAETIASYGNGDVAVRELESLL